MNTASQNFEILKTLLLKQVDAVNYFQGDVYGKVEISPENFHEIAEMHFFGNSAVIEYPQMTKGEYKALIDNAAQSGATVLLANAGGSAYTIGFGPILETEIDKAYEFNQSIGNGVYSLERAEWDHDRKYFASIHSYAVQN